MESSPKPPPGFVLEAAGTADQSNYIYDSGIVGLPQKSPSPPPGFQIEVPEKLKELTHQLFTPATKLLGGSTVTDVYDMAADSAVELISRVTGKTKQELRKEFPGPAFLNQLVRGVPELLDFAQSPGGLTAALASRIPGVQPAIGAAFTMDIGSQIPTAWSAVKEDPSAENIANLLKTSLFAGLPLLHAGQAEMKGRGVGRQMERMQEQVADYEAAPPYIDRLTRMTGEELKAERTVKEQAQDKPALAEVNQEIAARQKTGDWKEPEKLEGKGAKPSDQKDIKGLPSEKREGKEPE